MINIGILVLKWQHVKSFECSWRLLFSVVDCQI